MASGGALPQSRRPGNRLDAGGLFAWAAASEQGSVPKLKAKAKSAIFINLGGGPSHTDTFDLKPTAPTEYRGSFTPVETSVSGIRICEHLPKLAACFQHFALLRSVTHSLAAHELGTQYVLTGSRPLASLQYPSYGSVVSKELKGPRDLPSFVAIPNSSMTSGFLGVQYSALSTSSVPRPGQKYGVRGISLGNGLTVVDVEKRQHLLTDLTRPSARSTPTAHFWTGSTASAVRRTRSSRRNGHGRRSTSAKSRPPLPNRSARPLSA